jgi:hypothetical protein
MGLRFFFPRKSPPEGNPSPATYAHTNSALPTQMRTLSQEAIFHSGINHLRERAKRELGRAFDLKAFHDVVRVFNSAPYPGVFRPGLEASIRIHVSMSAVWSTAPVFAFMSGNRRPHYFKLARSALGFLTEIAITLSGVIDE